MTRVLDLRLVLDREDRLRVHVDGRELVRATSAAEALRFIAEGLAGKPAREQLDALASAIVGAVEPAPVLALVRCDGCRELVRLESDGCPVCAMQRGPRRSGSAA